MQLFLDYVDHIGIPDFNKAFLALFFNAKTSILPGELQNSK